jgi:hypothetical protein
VYFNGGFHCLDLSFVGGGIVSIAITIVALAVAVAACSVASSACCAGSSCAGSKLGLVSGVSAATVLVSDKASVTTGPAAVSGAGRSVDASPCSSAGAST